jgi:hypothetical protein
MLSQRVCLSSLVRIGGLHTSAYRRPPSLADDGLSACASVTLLAHLCILPAAP